MSKRREGSSPPAPEPLRVATVDSHTHLDALETDVADVVAQARAVGVTAMVTTGDTVESSRWCAATAASYDEVYAAVAIHPNEVGSAGEETYAEIARLAALPEVSAVGETGLDYYWERVDPQLQRQAFRRHIDIAKHTGKALVIHDRDAHADVLDVLAADGAPEHTVMHCFSGDAELARTCAERGYLMSFAGTVTFKNAADLRAAAEVAPPDLVVVETDAPYLTPMPYRGRPNAPYLMPLTVRCLAEVRGVGEDELAATAAANAARVFGLGVPPS
ncbi:MAG: YchF/TatD family DNA exonuclease [Streptosporangiales bacterium]|nr:YchF/TatD family DNA exonuclease [Streptosporangiales bacterium]